METIKKTILFDLFATLAYIEADQDPITDLCKQMTDNAEDAKAVRDILESQNFASLDQFVAAANQSFDRTKPVPDADIEEYERIVKRDLPCLRLYDETVEVLAEVKKMGLPIGVISTSPSVLKQAVYDLPIKDYIDYSLFSCDCGLIKPDKRIFSKAIRDMGMDVSQSWMIGDSLTADIQGAKAVDLNALLVDRKNEHDYQPKVDSLKGIFDYIA